ncbi:DUF4974 domain-containing protein [Prolixibacteraceae bacterium JC049]|nr:DUF4974 domain-containing protein [Prolixibacteraceae bacterium JC049]
MEWHLISRCLSGEATNEEKQKLTNWINECADNKKLYEKAKLAWKTSASFKLSEEYDVDKQWRGVQNKIHRTNNFRRISMQIMRYAAVALVAVISSYFIWGNRGSAAVDWFQVVVPKGEQTNLVLADGTKVQLNSETVFAYPSNFSRTNRIARLNGEGFFEVTSDKEHPFTIETHFQDVKVLGTKFNLNAYENSDSTVTALLHGVVALFDKAGRKVVELKPTQKAVLKNQTGKILLRKVDEAIDAGWKDGIYYFKSIRLSELVELLERWYGMKITINSDQLKNERFTGTFFRDQTIWQALDLLRLTMPIDYLPGQRTIQINYKN